LPPMRFNFRVLNPHCWLAIFKIFGGVVGTPFFRQVSLLKPGVLIS
jgi:hypothetical protein